MDDLQEKFDFADQCMIKTLEHVLDLIDICGSDVEMLRRAVNRSIRIRKGEETIEQSIADIDRIHCAAQQ